jgi:hypothetical protein
MTRYLFHVRPSGETTVLGQEVLKSARICIGRRLSGASPRAGHAASELGGLFAMASELEAESVESFFTLAKTLRRFAAPESLVRAAEAAARDERRHARSMGRLAARFGATPRAPRSGGREARSLFELARDNGVEGCVRETFGALVATRQAMAARDPYVAEAMRSIARDETRHAALAFAVAAWVKPALTELEQTELERAIRAAILALEAECAEDPSAALCEAAGLPSANTALAMLGALEREVWSASRRRVVPGPDRALELTWRRNAQRHRLRSMRSVYGVGLMALAAACGGESESERGPGTASMCAGQYVGSYTGDDAGTLTGTLSPDGSISVTFTDSDSQNSVSGQGALGADGQISMDVGVNQVAGRLDDQCRAGGSWTFSSFGGNWQMQRQ